LRDVVRTHGYKPFVPDSIKDFKPGRTSLSPAAAPFKAVPEIPPQPQRTATMLEKDDTTLMINDLPYRLTSINKLVQALDDYGFGGTYDLVYIPPKQRAMRIKTDSAFCFVNFKAPKHAAAFVAKSDDLAAKGVANPFCARRAKCQGYAENLKIHTQQCSKRERDKALRTFKN